MLATVWLLERGSPESKPIGKEGAESDRAQRIGGWAGPDAPNWARVRRIRTWVYSNSLLLVMLAIFFGCASAAHRSQSRSAPRTTPPAPTARRGDQASSRLRILPVALRGSESRNSTSRGTL